MCNPSILALTRNCEAAASLGGSEKLYMVAFSDLATLSGSTEVYSQDEDGIVEEIGLKASKKFVGIDLLKSTSGLASEMTKAPATGSLYFTNTLTLVLGGMTTENLQFIESVKNQPVAIVIKSRTGNFFASGLNGQFELATATGGNGIAETDLNGYTLTFSGIEGLPKLVDPTIVPGLIA